MAMERLAVESIHWHELAQITRMTMRNLGNVDVELQRMLRNPLLRPFVRLVGPFYLALGGRGYKIVVDGEIAGCAFLNLRRQSSYIYNVQVNEAFRRQGVGQELMLAMERVSLEQGYPWLALFVDRRNEAARALYRKTGYRQYFGEYWRRRIPDAWPRLGPGDISAQHVRATAATDLFKHYNYHELLEGDTWAASVVSGDYGQRLPRSGVYFRCLAAGEEIGFAWSEYMRNRPVISLYLHKSVWHDPAVLQGLLVSIRQKSGFQGSYLDLYLGSSAHSEARQESLTALGFVRQTQARLLLLKKAGAPT